MKTSALKVCFVKERIKRIIFNTSLVSKIIITTTTYVGRKLVPKNIVLLMTEGPEAALKKVTIESSVNVLF